MKALTQKYICLVLAFFMPVLNLCAQVIEETDFENNSNGWSHYPSTQPVNWQFSSGLTTNGPSSPQHGSVFFYVNNIGQNPAGEVAIVKTFDFTNYVMPVLSFYYYCDASGDYYSPRFTVKTWYEGEWNEGVGRGKVIIEDQGDGWQKINVCLSKWSGKSNVQIKIASEIVNSPCANVAIDNLKIENFYIDDSPENFKDAECYGGTGEVTIKPVGGGPVYQYALDDKGFDEEEELSSKVYTNVAPGDYYVKVKDVQTGCIAVPTQSPYISVKQPAKIETDINIDRDVSCYANSDGIISITASEKTGNNEPYYYSVSAEKNQHPNDVNSTFNLLKGGTYYVRVRNSKGCVSSDDSVKLGEDRKLIINSVSVTNITDYPDGCYGEARGQIIIDADANTKSQSTGTMTTDLYCSVDGGSTYKNVNEKNFSGLAAKSYKVVVKDANGCTVFWQENPIVVKQPEKLEFEASEFENITGCNGDATGRIQVNVKGGTTPLSYYLNSEVEASADGNFENLTAGTYYPIVVDGHHCKLYSTDNDADVKVTITEPTPVEVTKVSTTDVLTCFGDNTGKIEISAKGGTNGLWYLIYPKPIEENTAEPITLPDYSENNVFENLKAGTYFVTVKDKNNCEYKYYEGAEKLQNEEIEVFLGEPAKFSFIQATETSVSNVCYGDEKGQVYVSVQGGTLPYSFNVVDGENYDRTESFSEEIGNIIGKLPAGKYTVYAKDKMNCEAEESYEFEITQPEELVIEGVEITNVDCFLNATGQALVTAKGGTGSYSYGFRKSTTDPDAGFGGYVATPEITGLRAGEYDFVVIDANKCSVVALKNEVTQPEKLEITEINPTDVKTCHGDAAGQIFVKAGGGTGPYMYSIDDGETLHDYNIFKDLSAGRYYPFVQDKNGCTARPQNYETTLSEPNKLVIQNLYYHEVEGCNGTANGAIRFDADGGTGVWKFSIDAVTFVEALTGNYPNLKAGTYYPMVEDEHGCHARAEKIIIEEPDPMNVVSFEVNDAICYGRYGDAKITVEGGRIFQLGFPYSFHLNGGKDPVSYDGKLDFLEAGTYEYEIKDKYGCTLSGSFSVSQPDSVAIVNLVHEDVLTCYGDTTGTVSFSVKGGTEPFVFSAEGHNYYRENSTGVFKDMPATQYVLNVTDKNGCFAEDVITLTQPEKLVYSAELTRKIACHNDGGAEITVSASGGTGELRYSVDGGLTYPSADSVITGLQGGHYKIKVRDANGCTQKYTDDINVVNPEVLMVDYESYDVICHEGNTGKIVATASGGTKPYFYSLDSVNWQQVTGLFDNLSDGAYVVKVHDQNDCVVQTDEINLKRPNSVAGFSVSASSGCSPLSVVFTQDYQGLISNYEISNGDKIFDRVAPTEYTFVNEGTEPEIFKVTSSVLYTARVGCDDTSSVLITVYPKPKIDFRMGFDSIVWPESTANFVNMTKGVQSVHWDFGDGTTSDDPEVSTHEYSSCGNYNIVLSVDDGRCTNTLIKPFVVAPRPLAATFSSSKLYGCQPWDVSAKNESKNSDSCKWDFGDGSDPVYNLSEVTHSYPDAGDYVLTLTIYGDCGSQAVTTKQINVFSKPEAGFEQNLDTLYSGQYLKLEADAVSADSYKWNFGDGTFGEGRTIDHRYEFEGTFNVSLTVFTANSCSDTATTHSAVTVINSPIVLYPNAFSPDGDGKNDVFKPIHGDVAKFKLVILNRRGVIVFQTTNIDEGWDGTRNGRPCPPDMYVWKAMSVLRDKQTIHQKGNIYLFR